MITRKQLITEREYKFLIELSKKEGLDVWDITSNTDICRYHVYIVANELIQKGFIVKKKIDRDRYFLSGQAEIIKIRDKEIKRIHNLFNLLTTANPEKFVIKEKKNSEVIIKNNIDYCKILISEVKKWSPSMARRLRKKMADIKKDINK